MNIRDGVDEKQLAYDRAMVDYIVAYGTGKINGWLKALRENSDFGGHPNFNFGSVCVGMLVF